jgi:uncharacterized protein (TIGR00288 family)
MSPQDSDATMAVFIDLENIAIGAREAQFPDFEIRKVIERLLLKGHIVVKKAYCDFERYKTFKRGLHEAAFELIEIPHVSYSGKNSADIRLVVDALDLCYAKAHVDVFVIVSGDSDFSPLVSKLRENDKRVIGVGVKNSSSKLLIDNCDEFLYYDDLVRERKNRAARAKPSSPPKAQRRPKTEAEANQKDLELRKAEALDIIVETVEALFRDRSSPLWGSHVKQTIMRKRPNFSETFHGYRSFNQLLEDAQRQGLLQLQKDEPSGGYIVVGLTEHAEPVQA